MGNSPSTFFIINTIRGKVQNMEVQLIQIVLSFNKNVNDSLSTRRILHHTKRGRKHVCLNLQHCRVFL